MCLSPDKSSMIASLLQLLAVVLNAAFNAKLVQTRYTVRLTSETRILELPTGSRVSVCQTSSPVFVRNAKDEAWLTFDALKSQKVR